MNENFGPLSSQPMTPAMIAFNEGCSKLAYEKDPTEIDRLRHEIGVLHQQIAAERQGFGSLPPSE